MKKAIYIIVLLHCIYAASQVNSVTTIYFDLDKFELSKEETQRMFSVLDSVAISKAKTIHLYGYCDDRGSRDYNYKLSYKRVDYIQNLLTTKGFVSYKTVLSEGRGKVQVDKDSIKDLDKIRDKNRRVDLIYAKNVSHTSFPEKPKIDDTIILKTVIFAMGSSELSQNAKRELDKLIIHLNHHKTARFEIKGHVCCTSNSYKDAIDKNTEDRSLSENRAKNVYLYLRSKGINPYRMSFKGYGNQFPLGLHEKNDRRVELYITKI